MRKAFSYSRFSTSEQADGRSLQRQVEQARAYCARHGLALDERSFADLGVSGRHGANATHGELAEFLELVEEGRIPAGSVLIVENVDRLSRLPPDEATALIMRLVESGIDVATVSPEALYSRKTIHQVGVWVPLQVALCLAAEESRKKGERLADAWASKRAATGEGVKLSKKGPAWLKLTDDRKGWVVVEEKANAVRRAFQLCLEGHGAAAIAGTLHKEYPEGLSGRGWQPSYIVALLRSIAVIGEKQLYVGTCAKRGRKATRKPVGEPIKGYFPPIVEKADFYRVQGMIDGRRKGGGRTTGTPNLFNGILYDAYDGCRMNRHGTNGIPVLVSSGAVRKMEGSVFRTIRYEIFEEVVLSELAELKTSDVIAKPGAAETRVEAISGRLSTVNRKLDAVRARITGDDEDDTLIDLAAELGKQKKGLIEELARAKAEAASQEGDTVGELKSLVTLLREATPDERDDLRRRIRVAIRRVVSGMWLLIVTRPEARYAFIQGHFHGTDATRLFGIILRKDGTWKKGSFRLGAALMQLWDREWSREFAEVYSDPARVVSFDADDADEE